MAKIGYARVSTLQQDLNEQLKALESFGCKKIFSGKHSGRADKNQSHLNELLNYVREGGVVVVKIRPTWSQSFAMSQCIRFISPKEYWIYFPRSRD